MPVTAPPLHTLSMTRSSSSACITSTLLLLRIKQFGGSARVCACVCACVFVGVCVWPPAVQPRKPFVQEINRKKDRTVFQCPPYIFPCILSPYVIHVLYRYISTVRRSTVPVQVHVPAQIYSMHVPYCCTGIDLRARRLHAGFFLFSETPLKIYCIPSKSGNYL